VKFFMSKFGRFELIHVCVIVVRRPQFW
jgi:hypothetical protein